MSLLSIYLPQRLEMLPSFHTRNGLYPNAGAYSGAIAALNHTLAYRKQQVYSYDAELGDTSPAPGNWRFRFRTGYGTRSVNFIAIIGLAIELGSDPYVNIELTEEGGSPTNLTLHYGATQTAGSGAPEEWSIQAGEVAVSANSAYTCLVTIAGGASSISLTAHEVGRATASEATDYFSEFTPTAGAPILDDDIQRLILGPSQMLRRNRALYAHWHLADGAARTRTSSTPISLIDNVLTGTPVATAAGWRFVTTAHNKYSRSTVPVELSVYGSITGGATGTVRIRDTAGTDLTVNVTGASDAWHTGTGTISVGAGQLYVPMLASNGVATLTISAASLHAWET